MKVVRFTSIAAFLILSSIGLHAQILWKQTNGPIGGNVTCICVDSSQRLTISTQLAGYFRSSNSGETWVSVNKGLEKLQGKQIATDGFEYTYSIGFLGEFMRIKNTEDTWENIDPAKGLAPVIYYSDLLVSQKRWVYLAGGGSGILRSKDRGLNWDQSVKKGKDTSFTKLALSKSGKLYAITITGTVFTSTDDGDTWTKLPTSAPRFKTSAILSFAVSENDDIIAGQSGGAIYRSSNQGQSWTTVFQHPNNHDILYMTRSPNTDHLFISTFSNLGEPTPSHIGGIFRSTDNGVSWVLRDQSEHGDAKFYMAFNKADELFHVSVPAGVIKSTDEGQTWTEKNANIFAQLMVSVVVNSKGTVFCATQAAVNRSYDDGNSWQRLDVQTQEVVQGTLLRVFSDDVIYHGTIFGMFRSSNDGNSWSHVLKSDTGGNFVLNDLQEAPWGDVFACSAQKGLLVSNDHGINWHTAPNLKDTIFQVLACAKKDTIIAAADGSSFYRSDNRGIDWTIINPVDNQGCSQLSVHPDGSYLARFSSRVSRSPDRGVTWQPIFPPVGLDTLRYWQIWSFYIDRNNNILVTTDSGIYRSKSAPYSDWEFLNAGLKAKDFQPETPTSVRELAQNKSTGVFYAASRGQSIYRSVPDLGIHSPLSSTVSTADQNYPNPFSLSTTIEFDLFTPEVVTIEIFDVMGRNVKTLMNERRDAGTNIIHVDASDLPNGNYLYVIRYGDVVKKNWMTLTK